MPRRSCRAKLTANNNKNSSSSSSSSSSSDSNNNSTKATMTAAVSGILPPELPQALESYFGPTELKRQIAEAAREQRPGRVKKDSRLLRDHLNSNPNPNLNSNPNSSKNDLNRSRGGGGSGKSTLEAVGRNPKKTASNLAVPGRPETNLAEPGKTKMVYADVVRSSIPGRVCTGDEGRGAGEAHPRTDTSGSVADWSKIGLNSLDQSICGSIGSTGSGKGNDINDINSSTNSSSSSSNTRSTVRRDACDTEDTTGGGDPVKKTVAGGASSLATVETSSSNKTSLSDILANIDPEILQELEMDETNWEVVSMSDWSQCGSDSDEQFYLISRDDDEQQTATSLQSEHLQQQTGASPSSSSHAAAAAGAGGAGGSEGGKAEEGGCGKAVPQGSEGCSSPLKKKKVVVTRKYIGGVDLESKLAELGFKPVESTAEEGGVGGKGVAKHWTGCYNTGQFAVEARQRCGLQVVSVHAECDSLLIGLTCLQGLIEDTGLLSYANFSLPTMLQERSAAAAAAAAAAQS